MMLRDMVRAPLEQTIIVLWLIGVGRLCNRFAVGEFSFSWVAASVLASVLAIYFLARYRMPLLWPLPVLFGLAALLVLLDLLGIGANGLALASVFFALGLWLELTGAKKPPLPVTIAKYLGLGRYDDNAMDAARIIGVIHHTLFVIALGGAGFQFADSGLLAAERQHGPVILITMPAAALFFWSSGRVYRKIKQTYLALLFSILTVIELVSLVLHRFSLETIFYDRYAGLLFALLGLAMCAVSRWLKPAGTDGPEDSDDSLYQKPLMFTALLMAVIGIQLQTLQMLGLESMTVHPLANLVLLLSAACLLSANYRLRLPLFDPAALLTLILALMWQAFYWLHPGLSFSLWPGGGYDDQWLLLGFISLALAFFSYYLERRQAGLINYCPSVTAASVFCYGWALFHVAVLFVKDPFSESPFLAWMCLVFIAAQFPLLRNVLYNERIRAAAIALFLLIGLINLLGVIGRVDLLRTGMAVYAYWLLFAACTVLPLTNQRWPQWAIAPDGWPWIGLVLIYAGLLTGGPVWPQEWPWLLVAAIYQLLLRRSYLDLPALMQLVLSVLWLQAERLHPGAAFSLWTDRQTDPDVWLTLGLAALIYSAGSQWLQKFPHWAIRYSPVLQAGAVLCFGWSFLGAAVLFLASGDRGHPLLPWIFTSLLVALFPLSKNLAAGMAIRGAGSALLFSSAFLSLLLIRVSFIPLQIEIALSGYLLWLAAACLIPLFNRRLPGWAIDSLCWPWLGLLLVTLSCVEPYNPIVFSLTLYLLLLSGYCLLMLRYSKWTGFSWAAALAFTAVGIVYGSQYPLDSLQTQTLLAGFSFNFAVNTLLWANLQLLVVRLVNVINPDLFVRFKGRRQDLAAAFEYCASLILVGWLLASVFLLTAMLGRQGYGTDIVLINGLLSLSLLHRLSLRCSLPILHGFILSLLLIAWTGNFAYMPALVHLSLFPALWCLLLVAACYLSTQWSGKNQQMISQALDQWSRASLLIAAAALPSCDAVSELLLPLAILAGLTAFLGLWTLRPGWFALSCVEFLVFLHIWPFAWVSFVRAPALLPWFALQAALPAWLVFAVLSRYMPAAKDAANHSNRVAICRIALAYWPWLIIVSLAELVIHALSVRQGLSTRQAIDWLFSPWDAVAALAAGFIVLGFGMRQGKNRPDSLWIYADVMLFIGLGFYSRMIAVGLAPVGLWDTALLIVFAYALFFLQRIFSSRPLLNLALLMPLFALLTVPLQLESTEAGATLLVTGILYLLIRRYTQEGFPAYLALLAFNVGLYLWIPGIAEESQLIQVYVIPAALSILIMLQLHHQEIKPGTLMAIRLAATGSIYAGATLDVFLLPGLGIFVLALLLGLVGIILGIALRIRAFLYTGASFLLLNIIGQLIRFYPEQALGKALILMTVGMAILCLMIWFNLKRVAIMQRIDLFRAELQQWE